MGIPPAVNIAMNSAWIGAEYTPRNTKINAAQQKARGVMMNTLYGLLLICQKDITSLILALASLKLKPPVQSSTYI